MANTFVLNNPFLIRILKLARSFCTPVYLLDNYQCWVNRKHLLNSVKDRGHVKYYEFIKEHRQTQEEFGTCYENNKRTCKLIVVSPAQ